ncbi:MAG TPA: GTP-binding protein [Acidimicrobiia bacterium]
MRKPLIVITGVDPMAMQSTMSSLVWDLPGVVSIRHVIDPITQQLSRYVSSVNGSVETAVINLEHACVGCAIREDIMPTILRIAQEPEWQTLVACLPISAEADHLSAAISRDPIVSRHVRLTNVIAAIPGEGAHAHLMSNEWLGDQGLQTGPGDPRSIGEAICAQIEYSDVVVADSALLDVDRDLVTALARPTSRVIQGAESVDVLGLLDGRHASSEAYAWRSPRSDFRLPGLGDSRAWRIDLTSSRPFHPDRLMDNIASLGGPYRSRGCFWVPTRPQTANTWDGVSGQVSIGQHSRWHPQQPITRLILTGVGCRPQDVHGAFADLLLTPEEMNQDPLSWAQAEDGLEPWLGDIPRAA